MNLETSRYYFNGLTIELRSLTNRLVLETSDRSTVLLSLDQWPALRDFIDRALTLHAVPQPEPEPEPEPEPSSELKPFNREAALAGAPVRTRDGRRVLAVAQNPDKADDTNPLVAWIAGDADIYTFTNEGTFYSDGEETQDDLFME